MIYNFSDRPLNWYDIKDYFKRHNDVKSDLIYESKNMDCEKFMVTIAIPTFRRSRLLVRAIESAIQQTGISNYEIIVVDNDNLKDESTDKIMKSYCKKFHNVRYFRNTQNIGITGNWNRCIELARGKWVVLLHDDDVMSRSYLNKSLRWANQSNCTLLGVFHTDLYDADFNRNVDENYGKKLKFRQNILGTLRGGKPFLVKKTDVFTNIYPSPVCIMLKKDSAIKFGGFDGEGKFGYDEKFFVTQLYHGKVLILPQILARRGVGANDSLNEEMQKMGIYGKYCFARHVLNKEKIAFKRYRKFCLDISAMYMVESVRGHFNGDVDFSQFLKELGVSRFVISMPHKMITVFKYLPLLGLICRRKH